ncbi:PDZ domain-containing protein [Ekhidna lutea]|uniref:PDZ domain-containing protein n=2 Tax=Ekhidna lutea TaxID=447679 RepID=A0A239EC92_EKHLU|nr:PDZ domain-containing protein [Ekhidna lutea]
MRNPIVSLVAFILLLNTCLYSTASGQKEFGFKMPEDVRKIEFPFEQHNNLIIIPITINRFLTLKFILDTGVENAILTEKLYADILDVNYIREITIDGPGLVDSVEAYIANEVTFSLPGGVIGHNMSMLVLKEDYLKLSENLGDDVHGIIGYDIFSRFIVDINYDDNVITLYNPAKFKKNRRSVEVPISIRGTKPFINASITQDGKKANLDIMIDTGASHAALIDYNYLDGVDLPEKTITTRLGRGIAGEIPGHVGRMDSVTINCFDFNKMLVSAPFEGAYNKLIKRGARVGTFGGELLNRFNVTFDYASEKIYLTKSDKHKDPFEFDMSGMALNAIGPSLDTLKVVNVDKGGPAFQADIREGDIIKSINGRSLRSHTLSEIYSLLQSKDGKKIKCKILRDGEKLKIKFRLKRVI